jgi:hypothetical protein
MLTKSKAQRRHLRSYLRRRLLELIGGLVFFFQRLNPIAVIARLDRAIQ